jgi:hypothetical protein
MLSPFVHHEWETGWAKEGLINLYLDGYTAICVNNAG